MRCSNQRCRAELIPGTKFCPSCGTKVEECDEQHTPPPLRGGMVSDPFELSAALPEAMQVERRSLVMVRFRAKEDIYEEVEFVLRNGEEELVRRACCPGRPLTSEHQVSLDVIPRTCGSARVALDVVCRVGTGGDVEVHTSVLQIAVDDSGKSTAFNPVINISQTQNSDRAGDSKGGDINVNLGGIKLHQEIDSARYETPTSFTPIRAELRISPTRLTLNGGSSVVQLVSDDVVTFGRNRDNVIPLRIFGADGAFDRKLNEGNISRYHFRISRTDRGAVVADGGLPGTDGKVVSSSYGTRMDGTELKSSGPCRIAVGRDVPLAVGRREVELKMRLRSYSDRMERPSGVLMVREDGAAQRVCVAWRDVPLTDAETVSWSGCRWLLLSRPSGMTPLFVGAVISIGGASFEVQPFHHTHLN